MSKLTNFTDFKNKKKYQKIVEDLGNINHVLDLTQRSLIHYKRYKNVQEIVSIIETNLTLLQMYKTKYEKLLKE